MRKLRALIFLFSMVAIAIAMGQAGANREGLKPDGTPARSAHLVLKP
jgi:hypothetical protein